MNDFERDRELMLAWMRGDADAARFLHEFFFVCHLWDDLIDGDVERESEHVHQAMWMALTTLPGNPFFLRHHAELLPVIRNAILQWLTANELEQPNEDAESERHDRTIAYTTRVSIVGVIEHCALLVGGLEWARKVGPSIRGHCQRETLDEYISDLNKEPGHA